MEQRNSEFSALGYSIIEIFIYTGGTDVKCGSVVITAFFVRFELFYAVKRVAVFILEKMFLNRLFGIFAVNDVFQLIMFRIAFQRPP